MNLIGCKCERSSCRIRRARWLKGLTRGDLATLMNVSPTAISIYERNHKKIGELMARRFQDALGLPWETLIEK